MGRAEAHKHLLPLRQAPAHASMQAFPGNDESSWYGDPARKLIPFIVGVHWIVNLAAWGYRVTMLSVQLRNHSKHVG